MNSTIATHAGIAAAVGALLALPACGSPTTGSAAQRPVSEPTSSISTAATPIATELSPRATASTSAAPASTSAAPASTSAAAVDEQPFAVRPGTVDHNRVKAYLYPVHRGGETSTVNLMIKSDDPNHTFVLGSSLGDHNPEVSASEKASVDGIRLIESGRKKAYLPATTGDGSCLCTPTSDAAYEYHTQVWVSVIFAAPPASVAAVDVFIPIFGTVSNVPVV
jgi:hypothetical protein